MTEAVPALVLVAGVKVAVRVEPVPLMAERLPPETETSPMDPFQKKELPGSSEKEKFMVAVSPLFKVERLLVMVSVGGVVSGVAAAWPEPLV